MGLFDRLGRLVKSNINDVIDKAEDPEKMLKQIVDELGNDLLQVKTQVAGAIATEKQLYQKFQLHQEEAEKWAHRAELAVDKGDDALAREALTRKNSEQATATGFQQQWEEQKKSVTSLKDNLGKLESKITEAQTKKDLLIARSRRADAEKRIQQTLSTSGSAGAMSAFERLESKVNDKEAQAAAYGELNSDSLEDKFAALEAGGGNMDDELAQLKARAAQKQLGTATEAPKQIGPGSPS
jgi:phage shock protein A